MALIALSWIYILFTTFNIGLATNEILKLKNINFVLTVILGLFTSTILASVWAIFGRINFNFHIFLLSLNVITVFKLKREISCAYISFWNELKKLPKSLQLYVIIIALLIIAQCSTAPYIIDNESYYIQTIKWLNEYGFVKGLVNLHPFFGQMSGWHIAQSAFNFSFLYQNLNDLSGFCLLLGNLFTIQKLSEYYENNDKTYLIIGLFPLANVFFFQFISAPSPDISIYVLSFIAIFFFLENFKKPSTEAFNIIVILTLFLLYIKNTSISFVIIPAALLFQNFKILYNNLVKPFLLSVFILTLFITKNFIVCGSPIYPTHLFNSFNLNYALPTSIETLFYRVTMAYGFLTDINQYDSMTAQELFLHWLSLSKLSGIFNKLSVLLVLICPFLIYKSENKIKIWILYLTMVLQLLLLLTTSPQYRFFINFMLFFSFFCLAYFIRIRQLITLFFALSLAATTVVLFIPFNLTQFSNNKFASKSSNFSIENIIYPHSSTKYDTSFEILQKGNLKYYSPIKNDFFWGNGNGDLPCVNKEQLEYFETYFHFIPQMRSNDLKDGFYAKRIIPNK